MADGYKQGADLLVWDALEDQRKRDFLVYPIVFSYRHYLELAIKLIIMRYGPLVGIESNFKGHELAPLWTTFIQVLSFSGAELEDNATQAVAECVKQFAQIDESSFAFRYSVDKKGTAIPLSLERLDLDRLADVMDGIYGYFTGVDGWLDARQSV